MTAEQSQSRSNTTLWVLIAVTILPFTAAWIVHLNPSLLGDMKTSNRGELVTPPRPLPALEWETLNGEALSSSDLEGNWTMLTVAGSACDETCELNLYHLRQIRLAMGEDRKRVLRILLLQDTDNLDQLASKLAPFEGTIVLTGSQEARGQLLDVVSPDATGGAADRIFLIDPQGRLMMAYPPKPDAKDVVKDLQRLLRVVQS